MKRKSFIATLAAALALATTQLGSALSQPFGSFFYGPSMVRAEAVLKVGTDIHDYRVDRGRVRAVTATSVTLRERDGHTETIAIGTNAGIQVNGRPATLAALRRGMDAVAVREGDDPAELLHAAGRRARAGAFLPQGLVTYLFGPTMIRTEAVLKINTVVRDYRIDRGRVRAVTPTSVTLKERDGLVVTVPVSPTTRVNVNGRLVGLAGLRRGMEAMTIRAGDDAAETVHVPPRR